jgi:hypothetical protein
MRLDLKENIVFPFSDPSWITKTLIGSACYLLVLPIPALVGYQISIIRQTANGEDEKLPEFEGFMSLWLRGFVVTAILAVLLALPTIGFTGVVVGGLATFGQESMGTMIAAILVALFGLLAVCLAFMALVPAMTLRYAMTEQVSSFFDVSTAIGDIKQGVGDYLMIVLFPVLASLALTVLSFLTAGLGFLLTVPVTVLIMYIQARMIGNFYRLYFM